MPPLSPLGIAASVGVPVTDADDQGRCRTHPASQGDADARGTGVSHLTRSPGRDGASRASASRPTRTCHGRPGRAGPRSRCPARFPALGAHEAKVDQVGDHRLRHLRQGREPARHPPGADQSGIRHPGESARIGAPDETMVLWLSPPWPESIRSSGRPMSSCGMAASPRPTDPTRRRRGDHALPRGTVGRVDLSAVLRAAETAERSGPLSVHARRLRGPGRASWPPTAGRSSASGAMTGSP